MKKQLLLFTVLLVAVFLFNSCKKAEQSEFTIGSVKGSATIKGTVIYDEGSKQVTEDGEVIIIKSTVSAEGQTVLVLVPYNYYSAGSVGNKIFKTVVAEDGSYSINIPVGVNTLTATVEVQPFNATYYDTLNKNIIAIENALYNTVVAVGVGSNEVELNEYDVENLDLKVTTKDAIESTDRTLEISINGEISVSGLRNVDHTISRRNNPIVCSAKVTLSNTNDYVNDTRKIQYTVLADYNGEFTVDATFYNGWEYGDVMVTLSVDEFYDKDSFKHYYKEVRSSDYYSQSIAGLYSQPKVSTRQLSSINQDGEIIPIIFTTLEFRPLDARGGIRGIGYAPVDYEDEGYGDKIYEYNDFMDWGSGSRWF